MIALARRILRRPGPLHVSTTWYGLPQFHGPHTWPFWRWFRIRFSGVAYIQKPDFALRIWLYTRKGSGFIQFHKERPQP